uniref:DNA-directed RNA polymerase subunit n=1 Tax=Albugo laibachii Nc14 TaxID=890382 RepID=F0WDI8_9STRA|nr:DNAdirected RNA polymerases III 12.5 kDa polypeptide putative [Albugo laibachii Nc14]|eukprot:CCA19262.1 DNAdirected RNA polymerases III 12.5 kDa polypeptide putative [Albugo laibachii Nc14]
MHFCPSCGNILLIEPSVCALCLEVEASVRGLYMLCKTRIEKRVKLQRKQVDAILGGDEAWDNVNQTEAWCPHCEHNHAYFMQIQIRSADEPSTTFYKCVQCKKQWNS